jgi:hypothetical protein
MTEEVFYKKIGRRYVPVTYYNSKVMDGVPIGTHLIIKTKNSESRRYSVEPALAPMIAAGSYAMDTMTNAVYTRSEMRHSRALNKEELAAFEVFKKQLGPEVSHYVQYPSAQEIAEAGIKALSQETEKLLTHPAVRAAYDQFLFVAKLAYENHEI